MLLCPFNRLLYERLTVALATRKLFSLRNLTAISGTGDPLLLRGKIIVNQVCSLSGRISIVSIDSRFALRKGGITSLSGNKNMREGEYIRDIYLKQRIYRSFSRLSNYREKSVAKFGKSHIGTSNVISSTLCLIISQQFTQLRINIIKYKTK